MKRCIQEAPAPASPTPTAAPATAAPQRGQCSQPYGKTCYVQNGTTTGCDSGGTCVVDSGGNNLHRNIIFRNANVPAAAGHLSRRADRLRSGRGLPEVHRHQGLSDERRRLLDQGGHRPRLADGDAQDPPPAVQQERPVAPVRIPFEPAQPEPERRRHVPDAGERRGRAGPRRARAAGRDLPDQGRVRVPLLEALPGRLADRRLRSRRAVRLREHELGEAGRRLPGRAQPRGHPALELRAQRAQGRHALPAAARRPVNPFQLGFVGGARQSQRHAGRERRRAVRQDRGPRRRQLRGLRPGARRAPTSSACRPTAAA